MNTANKLKNKIGKRTRRRVRIRAKLFGTAARPRLAVFRSNRHIYAQLVDDEKRITLASASDESVKTKSAKKASDKDQRASLSAKLALASSVGKLIAEKAKELKIEAVVFDRGGYLYHGRVKSLAEGAREAGLKF